MSIKFQSGLLIFLAGLLFISCASSDSRFISEVEKLEQSIALSEQSLQSIDTSRIGTYFRKSNENLKYIQDNNKDTLDKQTAILLSDYSASRKSMRMFLENYHDVTQELAYSRKQLNDLKTDLRKNLLAEDKFSDFYSAESKSVKRLEELVENLGQWHDSAIKMHEAKSPPIEKMVENLKKEEGFE